MEEIIQRIFSILIAVIIFFLLPLYIAFEKKDDISYALALKITTNFVDDVTDKGYLTQEMYDDFITEISATGNVYDVQMEYVKKEYNPVIQIIGKTAESGDTDVIVSQYDYLEKKVEFETYDKDPNNDDVRDIIFNGEPILDAYEDDAKAQVTYKLSEKKYFTDQILDFLSNTDTTFLAKSDTSYSYYGADDTAPNVRIYGLANEGLMTMNKGDQFTVYIKNENTTIATVLFNTLTFGANSDNDTKVYVNYGGTVKNQEYKVDLIGDVNQDGIVDDKDSNLIAQYTVGSISLTTVQKIAADVNEDGYVTVSDASAVSRLEEYRP